MKNFFKNICARKATTPSYEKPYEGNAAILRRPQTSKYDPQAEALRQKIVNAKDANLKGAATYYVSYKGSDSNTGLSKNSPWRSLSKVEEMIPEMPDNTVVLFERGGVYRGTLRLKSNMSLGAYGSGQKPCIYGCSKNYADESLWEKHSDNIWKVDVKSEGYDVGCMVFDHGKMTTVRKETLEELKEDYNLYCADDVAYIYLSEGNPAKIYSDIEMNGIACDDVANRHIITGEKGIKNVVIDNLCIKYGGIHGINFVDSENITIQYCELGYIGGAHPNCDTWCGNAIQFWENCDGAVIDHCWVYQVYDAGITHQATKSIQQNVVFSNNLIEYCAYNIEYFVDLQEGEIKNVTYSDNILRFAGGGWAHPHDRRGGVAGGADTGVALICGWGSHGRTYETTNFVIENNILDTSYRYLLNISRPNEGRNAVISGNTYYQKASENAAICIQDVRTQVNATSDSQFKEEVAKIDATAKVVEFVE